MGWKPRLLKVEKNLMCHFTELSSQCKDPSVLLTAGLGERGRGQSLEDCERVNCWEETCLLILSFILSRFALQSDLELADCFST